MDDEAGTGVLNITCMFCGAEFKSKELGSTEATTYTAEQHECDPGSWRSAWYRVRHEPLWMFLAGAGVGSTIEMIVFIAWVGMTR